MCWLQPAMCYVALSRVQCLEQLLEEKKRLDEKDKKRKRDSLFKICSLNINSLNAHFEDLIADYRMLSSTVLCLQETWLHPNDCTASFEIPYKTLNLNSVRRGAGIAFYYTHQFSHLKDFTAMTYQISAISSSECVIINIYRSRNANNENLIKNLTSIIEHETKTIYICGDWNICHRDEKKHKIINFLQNNNFDPLLQIPLPTQREGRCLDMVWIRNPFWDKVELSIDFNYYSDHGVLSVDHFR